MRLSEQDVGRVTRRLSQIQQLPFSPMTSSTGAEAAWEARAIEDLTIDGDWVGLRILADLLGVSAGARRRANAVLAANGFPVHDRRDGPPAHHTQPNHAGYAPYDQHHHYHQQWDADERHDSAAANPGEYQQQHAYEYQPAYVEPPPQGDGWHDPRPPPYRHWSE